MSLQRYDLGPGWMNTSANGEYVRYADIEPRLPRWVPTSEKLPPIGRQVAVLHNLLNGMLVLHIGAYHGEGYWADRYGLSLDPVYYCELPTPPESP